MKKKKPPVEKPPITPAIISSLDLQALIKECGVADNLVEFLIKEKECKIRIDEAEANKIIDAQVLIAGYRAMKSSPLDMKLVSAFQKNRNQITANQNSRLMADKRRNSLITKGDAVDFMNFIKTNLVELKKSLADNMVLSLNDTQIKYLNKAFDNLDTAIAEYFKNKIENVEHISYSRSQRHRNKKEAGTTLK